MMRKICSGMMISTPMTISKLDSMKPSSKIASRMCSSYFLSLGLCSCSENPILPLLARNWLKNQNFPTHTGRPHGHVAHHFARASRNAAYGLVRSSAISHGQGCTAVWISWVARVWHRQKSHGHFAHWHGRVKATCARVCSRWKSHGHLAHLHGRAMPRSARAASLKPRHSSDLRLIDPKLAPKPPFTY
ncbi:unnamed protein product [Linum tenue]|uniref:Uncharacterized protein n=1 Tax=Linum tenue TaxID=586396 RepID=A0AAV0GWX8_9ROSI|nr:unnamed protein product [Linum tenue]